MELIPAIDLLDGAVVRLARGDYDQVTDYGRDPIAVARRWAALGATRLHLVDLEAARAGARSQASVIAAVVETVDIPCQVAGGIRDAASARALFRQGADRVVMGTALIRDPTLARSLVGEVGAGHLVAAVDIRDGAAVGDGWTRGATHTPALDHIERLRDAGARLFAVTAIDRDGLLTGPDLPTLAVAAEAAGGPDRIIASAGVSTLDDIRALSDAGYAAAILGRALYDGRFRLDEALAVCGA